MISREELLRSQEYWFETIQNDIYRRVDEYLHKNNMTQSQFAEKMGVSKGYISQILNGNFNATLKKLIELSIAIDSVPVFDFKNLKEYIHDDLKNQIEIQYDPYFKISHLKDSVSIVSGSESGFVEVNQPKNLKINDIAA